MQLHVLAVGSKMPNWIETAYADYAKRLPPEFKLHLKEIRPEPRSSGKTTTQMMALEATRIEAALPPQARLSVLDELGTDITTLQLAARLAQWQVNGQAIAFVIGGADGLAQAIKEKSELRIRLSSLTLPHGMVRVLLAEQLFRAWSINHNHPYHRA
ncbi:MAG: 23S rRNA (pseudouridine(1915)-N(3))-methyltransferase RlmH [Ottowia sp.]|nr:23S rRNA (pseudouridine(1915)-N(3))-methyltransferase RlmH [Ottowia sp.]